MRATIHLKQFFLLLVLLTFYSCKKAVEPKATTFEASDVTPNSFVVSGSAVGEKLIESGVCVSANQMPTIKDRKIVSDVTKGDFNVLVDSLQPGVTYHVRAYCADRLKLSYGEEIKVLVYTPPTITTGLPYSTTTNSFQCISTINFTGPGEKGICYSTNPNPTVNDMTIIGSSSSSAMIVNVIGLSANTTYYYRAYVNVNGVVYYGNEVINKTYLGTVTDIDGNSYYTVQIGNQVWMASNLRVVRYRDGSFIQPVGMVPWGSYTVGQYAQPSQGNGYFYNGSAVTNTSNIAPTGWHVPTSAEWTTLVNYLGGSSVAGLKLKATGQFAGTNESGFNASAAGYRSTSGENNVGTLAGFWSTMIYQNGSNYIGVIRRLSSNANNVDSVDVSSDLGFNIRCIKD